MIFLLFFVAVSARFPNITSWISTIDIVSELRDNKEWMPVGGAKLSMIKITHHSIHLLNCNCRKKEREETERNIEK